MLIVKDVLFMAVPFILGGVAAILGVNGAKKALEYAKRKKKEIENVFQTLCEKNDF